MSQRNRILQPDFLAHPPARRLVESTPLFADAANPRHLIVFRRIIEHAVVEGRWAGHMALTS